MQRAYNFSKKYLIWAFLSLTLIYFVYHTYNGERGLIARDTLSKEYKTLLKSHQEIQQRRIRLEQKVTSLGAGNGQIDADLLNEHAKRLGYISQNEFMITD